MILMALVAALLAGGCASVPSVIRAMAKDSASLCVSLDAALYGRVIICRTNTDGAALLSAESDKLAIQHRGK